MIERLRVGKAAISLSFLAGLCLVIAQGCTDAGVGDPCVPEQEYNPEFTGFNSAEVNVESKSFQCQTRLCLVNRFQGRVTCPYGQSANGEARTGSTSDGRTVEPCAIPGGDGKVTGIDGDTAGAEVRANCQGRLPNNAVYCSCRCANAEGRTDDGANYCECPDSFTCSQLIRPIEGASTQLAGAYCIRRGTEFKPADCGSANECNPADPASVARCGETQLAAQ